MRKIGFYQSSIQAEIYDIVFSEQFSAEVGDVSYYVSHLINHKIRTVVDFGCGAGRVSVPLAKNGCMVHAVDSSTEMLDRLRQKVLDLPPATASKIKIWCADSIPRSIEQGVDLILCAFRSFELLVDENGRSEFLGTARSVLVTRGGSLLIHIHPADPEKVVKQRLPDKRVERLHDSRLYRATFQSVEYDPARKVVREDWRFECESSSGVVREDCVLEWKVLSLDEYRTLFEKHGFEVFALRDRFADEKQSRGEWIFHLRPVVGT